MYPKKTRVRVKMVLTQDQTQRSPRCRVGAATNIQSRAATQSVVFIFLTPFQTPNQSARIPHTTVAMKRMAADTTRIARTIRRHKRMWVSETSMFF